MEEQISEYDDSIKEFILHNIHAYVREVLGDMAFTALSSFLIFLGIALLAASIGNSNLLLGNPDKRDRSQLGEIEYLKTRRILRIFLGVIGGILIVYNILALLA